MTIIEKTEYVDVFPKMWTGSSKDTLGKTGWEQMVKRQEAGYFFPA